MFNETLFQRISIYEQLTDVVVQAGFRIVNRLITPVKQQRSVFKNTR